jgi:hypothetical protein
MESFSNLKSKPRSTDKGALTRGDVTTPSVAPLRQRRQTDGEYHPRAALGGIYRSSDRDGHGRHPAVQGDLAISGDDTPLVAVSYNAAYYCGIVLGPFLLLRAGRI